MLGEQCLILLARTQPPASRKEHHTLQQMQMGSKMCPFKNFSQQNKWKEKVQMEVRLPLGMLSGLSSHPVLSSRFLDVNRTLFALSGIIASALFAEADRKNENKGLGISGDFD